MIGAGLDIFAHMLFVSFRLVWQVVAGILGAKARRDADNWNGR
jgi:hypothetical protein